MAETRARCRVAPEHPALPGHFPGRPLVPAVLLLELVQRQAAPGAAIARVLAAKFLRPVAPGTDMDLVWSREGARLKFRIETAGALAAQGELELAA